MLHVGNAELLFSFAAIMDSGRKNCRQQIFQSTHAVGFGRFSLLQIMGTNNYFQNRLSGSMVWFIDDMRDNDAISAIHSLLFLIFTKGGGGGKGTLEFVFFRIELQI